MVRASWLGLGFCSSTCVEPFVSDSWVSCKFLLAQTSWIFIS